MRFWRMTATVPCMERLFALEEEYPPRFSFINRSACSGGQDEAIPRILLSEPGFAPDLIFSGLLFASLRLREIMCLPEETVSYGPVATEGADAALKADYKIINLLTAADPIDEYRSEGEYADYGSMREWLRDGGGPDNPAGLIFWKDDFTPPAPVFRCDVLHIPLATEELADRVMRAGLDVAFVDQTGQTSRTEMVLRSVQR